MEADEDEDWPQKPPALKADDTHPWFEWAVWTLVAYPLFMIGCGYVLLQLGLMAANGHNNEQTVLAWLGLPVWYFISWLMEYHRRWRRVFGVVNRVVDSVFAFIGAIFKGFGYLLWGAFVLSLLALLVFGVLGLLWFGVKQLFG